MTHAQMIGTWRARTPSKRSRLDLSLLHLVRQELTRDCANRHWMYVPCGVDSGWVWGRSSTDKLGLEPQVADFDSFHCVGPGARRTPRDQAAFAGWHPRARRGGCRYAPWTRRHGCTPISSEFGRVAQGVGSAQTSTEGIVGRAACPSASPHYNGIVAIHSVVSHLGGRPAHGPAR